MAKTFARSSVERRRLYASILQKRLFLTNSISGASSPPLLPSYLIARRSAPVISAACRFLSDPSRFMTIRSRFDLAGDQSAYSPMKSGSNFSERPPREMAPLFPGCDYEHWLIVMDKPGGEGATKQQMIDCYVETLSKVLSSEEDAKNKIYNISCERYFGFGCEIDEETSRKLKGLPGVLFVLPDSYVDAEYKDYGAELFANGEVVQRPVERQRRIDQFTTHRNTDKPKYHDKTRYARHTDNMQ